MLNQSGYLQHKTCPIAELVDSIVKDTKTQSYMLEHLLNNPAMNWAAVGRIPWSKVESIIFTTMNENLYNELYRLAPTRAKASEILNRHFGSSYRTFGRQIDSFLKDWETRARSRDPLLTIDTITREPTYEWDWKYLSRRANATIILRYPDQPWDWSVLSDSQKNPHCLDDVFERYPRQAWNRRKLSHKVRDLELVARYMDGFRRNNNSFMNHFSANPYLTIAFIIRFQHKCWNWVTIAEHINVEQLWFGRNLREWPEKSHAIFSRRIPIKWAITDAEFYRKMNREARAVNPTLPPEEIEQHLEANLKKSTRDYSFLKAIVNPATSLATYRRLLSQYSESAPLRTIVSRHFRLDASFLQELSRRSLVISELCCNSLCYDPDNFTFLWALDRNNFTAIYTMLLVRPRLDKNLAWTIMKYAI